MSLKKMISTCILTFISTFAKGQVDSQANFKEIPKTISDCKHLLEWTPFRAHEYTSAHAAAKIGHRYANSFFGTSDAKLISIKSFKDDVWYLSRAYELTYRSESKKWTITFKVLTEMQRALELHHHQTGQFYRVVNQVILEEIPAPSSSPDL